VLVGGASMPLALIESWQARDVDVVQGYGLTEASPNVLCLAPEDATSHVGTVGKPYSFVEVALHDHRTDTFIVGEGLGEIYIKGPNVFPGYWNNARPRWPRSMTDGYARATWPSATTRVLPDLRTRERDVYLGRRERVPSRSGTGSRDVRRRRRRSGCRYCASALGETGVAFVVAKRDTTLDMAHLTDHCRSSLASYKVPSQFRVIEELPRTSVGKIDRIRLTRLAQSSSEK